MCLSAVRTRSQVRQSATRTHSSVRRANRSRGVGAKAQNRSRFKSTCWTPAARRLDPAVVLGSIQGFRWSRLHPLVLNGRLLNHRHLFHRSRQNAHMDQSLRSWRSCSITLRCCRRYAAHPMPGRATRARKGWRSVNMRWARRPASRRCRAAICPRFATRNVSHRRCEGRCIRLLSSHMCNTIV